MLVLHAANTLLSFAITALLAVPIAADSIASTKRGLVFISQTDHPDDNYIFTQEPSDLTWYYNYGPNPSDIYKNLTQADFEFVPMLFSTLPNPATNTSFYDAVKKLIDGGRNISHVLTYNEPDGSMSTGGSDVSPAVGAQVWVKNIVPLQEMGIRVGLPACTGGQGGIPWLKQFLANCSSLMNGQNCTYDFVPLHWYGNFEGMASHIGEYSATFPNTSLWMTEYNLNDQSLSDTQTFYKQSSEYMDRLAYFERYSLFGSFRSSASNVGPNAAMLSKGGELTDIGQWYLGRDASGVDPSEGAACSARASWTVMGGAVFMAAAVLLV